MNPKRVMANIRRLIEHLPSPSSVEGKVVTLVGQHFHGNVLAKNGRWVLNPKTFRVTYRSPKGE